MVRPLYPSTNQVEEGEEGNDSEDEEEEIICTHLIPHAGSGQRSTGSSSGNPSSADNNASFSGTDAAKAGLVAGTAGVAVPTVATAGLTAVGFTGSGVAAGSMAAGIQAGIGNVAAGSLFATCQSIGATGGFAILGPLGLGAAAIGGVGYLGVRMWQNKKRNEELERQRREEEEQANKKLKDDFHSGGSGERILEVGEHLCPECRKKLLLRITKKYFKKKLNSI